MALKLAIPFPVFAPSPSSNPSQNGNPKTSNNRPPTEVRFSRWNNGPWKKINEHRRSQQEIEDDIRRHRRFDSATKIAQIEDSDPSTTAPTTTAINDVVFKSRGTPSSPSSPSIPGKKSKYSKPPNPANHPAFRRTWKRSKITNLPKEKPANPNAKLQLDEDGVSYVIDGAPFEFKYSYTETPKLKPVKLREPPYAPFGPTTMGRPWTGRAPLPPSKKKLKEFDSFELPPSHKKGVKPVQKPGPFLPGTGPRYVSTREEILGEPLTKEEIEELVHSCVKSQRQLNMGRDGLTHNMLDNIHAHWKRRRVCKIKCKGVCTVDMDNVCEQLEERTGGKIIRRKGGVLYLFRGRNYNYKTRQRFPLMLWKPVTPVYPRLIQKAPEGLTLEEASEMRKKGRKLIPIRKLGKNGVYCDLVKNVREAFEECELVRINCEGMNGSDYRKIGAKLKDLVPCVLISFEREHILIWRGREWKSSLPKPDKDYEEAKESEVTNEVPAEAPVEDHELVTSCTHIPSIKDVRASATSDMPQINSNNVSAEPCQELSSVYDNNKPLSNSSTDLSLKETDETMSVESEILLENGEMNVDNPESFIGKSGDDKTANVLEVSQGHSGQVRLYGPDMERVLLLKKQALESGIAMILDDENLDADIVYERSVSFAKFAPPGPVFRHRLKKKGVKKSEKKAVQKSENKETVDIQVKEEVATLPNDRGNVRQTSKSDRDLVEDYVDVVPQGSLKVDELAKLLA